MFSHIHTIVIITVYSIFDIAFSLIPEAHFVWLFSIIFIVKKIIGIVLGTSEARLTNLMTNKLITVDKFVELVKSISFCLRCGKSSISP